jgi:hypothetical protein
MAASSGPDFEAAARETAFALRADALDFLGDSDPQRARLEEVDARLFRRLRAEWRASDAKGPALRAMLDRYLGPIPLGRESVGYDHLDAFLAGLLHPDPIPEPTREPDADMVPFQKTPARIILELIERARPGPGDVFVDVGSGFGQVPMLVHALTGAKAIGIEIEPAYAAYARACAAGLGLEGVDFPALDARDADFAPASHLFLYTPFRGSLLESVLEKILREAGPDVRLFSFGPCTARIARLNGLRRLDGNGDSPHRLAEFARSRP